MENSIEDVKEKVNPIKATINAGVNVVRKTKNALDNITLQKPVITRVRDRMNELKVLSQAVNTKITHGNRKEWHTEPPEMFISNLENTISNGVGIITYDVYKMDEDGNKVARIHTRDVVNTQTGQVTKVDYDGDYEIDRSVQETIEYRKPIKVETFVAGMRE